jgi:hypothetical protein
MAYINLSNGSKANRASSLNTDVGINAIVRIYTGTAPADPGQTATGTLLVSLTCSASAFGVVTGAGVLTANAIATANAVATGTAGWARIVTSGGTGVIDLDVGTTGTSVIMNTTSIVSGGPVQITSAVITEA